MQYEVSLGKRGRWTHIFHIFRRIIATILLYNLNIKPQTFFVKSKEYVLFENILTADLAGERYVDLCWIFVHICPGLVEF